MDASSNPVVAPVDVAQESVDDSNPLFSVDHAVLEIDLSAVVGVAGTYTARVEDCCKVSVENAPGADFSQQLTFTVDGNGDVNVGPSFTAPALYRPVPVDNSVVDVDFEAVDPEGDTSITYQLLANTGSPDYGSAPLACSTFTGGHLRLGSSLCAPGQDFAAIYQSGDYYQVKVRAADSGGNSTDIDALLRVPVIPDPYIDGITVTGSSASVDIGLNDVDTVVDTYGVTCVNTANPADVHTAANATTPVTITGLVSGAAYDCSSTATNGLGTGTESGSYSLVPPAPALTAIAPATGYSQGGAIVTITGSGFTGVTAVLFGSSPATSFVVGNDTTITATAPVGTVGTVPITVVNPGGVSPITSAGDFSYVATPPPPPSVSGVTVSAPLGLVLTPGASSLRGRFVAPLVTGGSVSRYQSSLDGGATWSSLDTTVADGLQQFLLTGLTDGLRYTVFVRALSGEVAGAASAPASVLVGTPAGETTVQRVAGVDRVATSVSVSQQVFPGASRAPAAVLATSARFADSIGGARLASAVKGPLLLTDGNSLAADVATEVRRLVETGGAVYVLGDESALSDGVESALSDLNRTYRVKRLGGDNRYATAVAIAAEVEASGGAGPIYLATGTDFPDGLAVSALAAQTGGVVLLTDGSTLPAETAAYLKAKDPASARTIPIGGRAAAAYPAGASRGLVGADRYETAGLIADRFNGSDVTTIGLATGVNWPDALSGAAALGIVGGPLLLTPPDGLGVRTAASVDAIKAKTRVQNGWVFGGPSTLSSEVLNQFSTRVTK
ncbi:cell wall-binding repeat-containing protein [Kineococcus sp. R86509]|uniref:cell wall-binding repeat-containing protein n=1 Tax=Kineococcus sp. R86509 TaxID=3093851 RepID=UPI0036D31587